MLISSDHNPNSMGARIVLHKDGSTLDDIRRGIKLGKIRNLVVLGEDVTAEAAIPSEHLVKLDYLLVMDHTESATTRAADVVLPGVTFAEKYGTMVNVAGRIQRLNRAIDPLGGAKADWEILAALLRECCGDLPGAAAHATSAQEVLNVMAAQIEELGGVSWASIGNQGQQIIDTGVSIPLIDREKANK